MRKAENVEMYNFRAKAHNKFLKAITPEICQNILSKPSCLTITKEYINAAANMLWELDPCSAVTSGEFKGATSLMLYCALSFQAQTGNINIHNLTEIYINIINYPNLDINAMCIGDGPHQGKTVLWFAAQWGKWDLVIKLIEMGADMNTTCTAEGPHKSKSVLGMAKDYNVINKYNLKAIDKDVFYLILVVMELRSNHFEYPLDVILTNEDKTILEEFKYKINLYIKIFTPATIHFADNDYYKKNYLNDLPIDIRQLIAIEYIKQDLANYSLSSICIEYLSKKIAGNLFQDKLLKERLQAQSDLEKGTYSYELILFSSILSTLKDNTKMLDIPIENNTYENKKSLPDLFSSIFYTLRDNMANMFTSGNINKRDLKEDVFRNKFLPAFEKAKLQNKELASMNYIKRLELYEIAKQHRNRTLSQKPNGKTLTEDDFSAIFGYMPAKSAVSPRILQSSV